MKTIPEGKANRGNEHGGNSGQDQEIRQGSALPVAIRQQKTEQAGDLKLANFSRTYDTRQ